MTTRLLVPLLLCLAFLACAQAPATISDLVAEGAELVPLPGEYKFTEGPAVAANGDVYFTDIPNNRIHRWSPDGTVSVFFEPTGGANGLMFTRGGNLLACEGSKGRVIGIDPAGGIGVIAAEYEGRRFNSPNDLWIDAAGGVYFTDPVYGREVVQDGEHVYYVPPDRETPVRVIDDLVRPNGVIGTPDGKLLYVADHGDNKTYRYSIRPDGTLADKALFCESGSDGMTLDEEGNLYLTGAGVLVFSPGGEQIGAIEVPQRPTNLCFGGPDRRTLLITARTAVYTLHMRLRGAGMQEHGE